MKTVAEAKDDTEKLRENEKKWGKEAVQAGWSLIPNTLLLKQHALGLDPIDLNIILQIGKHWWRADDAPFPSHGRLAREMEVHVSTIKRHLSRLRDLGFVTWKGRQRKDGGQDNNAYDFSGLVAKVREYAVEELEGREVEKNSRKARQLRKRPQNKGAVIPLRRTGKKT